MYSGGVFEQPLELFTGNTPSPRGTRGPLTGGRLGRASGAQEDPFPCRCPEMQGPSRAFMCHGRVQGMSHMPPNYSSPQPWRSAPVDPVTKRKRGLREGLDKAETLACGELSGDVVRPFRGHCLSRGKTWSPDQGGGTVGRSSLEPWRESPWPWAQGARSGAGPLPLPRIHMYESGRAESTSKGLSDRRVQCVCMSACRGGTCVWGVRVCACGVVCLCVCVCMSGGGGWCMRVCLRQQAFQASGDSRTERAQSWRVICVWPSCLSLLLPPPPHSIGSLPSRPQRTSQRPRHCARSLGAWQVP